MKACLILKWAFLVIWRWLSVTFSSAAKMTSICLFFSFLLHLICRYIFKYWEWFSNRHSWWGSIYWATVSFFIQKNGKICVSIKSMYILIQSPIAYFGRFIKVMKEFSLQRCHNDYFVFYRCYEDINFLLLVYVDDIVIIGGDAEGTKNLRRLFSRSFKPKSLNWGGTSK